MTKFVVSFIRHDRFEVIVTAPTEEEAQEIAWNTIVSHPRRKFLIGSEGFEETNIEEITP